MIAKQLIVAVFLVGVSWAQRDFARDLENFPEYIVKQCDRHGDRKALEKIERALDTCTKNFGDRDEMIDEIHEALTLDGSGNEVFKKYCSRKDIIFECVTEFTMSLKQCHTGRARQNLDVIRNVIDQLLEDICEEDGAVFMTFIVDGAECLDEPDTKEVLDGCLYGLEPILQERSMYAIENVLDIDFGDRTCATLNEFQKCVVQELRTCNQEVANFAQSLIWNILTSTPCKYNTIKYNKPNSASGLTVTILSSVMAASCLLLM